MARGLETLHYRLDLGTFIKLVWAVLDEADQALRVTALVRIDEHLDISGVEPDDRQILILRDKRSLRTNGVVCMIGVSDDLSARLVGSERRGWRLSAKRREVLELRSLVQQIDNSAAALLLRYLRRIRQNDRSRHALWHERSRLARRPSSWQFREAHQVARE